MPAKQLSEGADEYLTGHKLCKQLGIKNCMLCAAQCCLGLSTLMEDLMGIFCEHQQGAQRCPIQHAGRALACFTFTQDLGSFLS